MIYQTLNHQIDEQALAVKNAEGLSLNIRPKTCQLLLLLVKNSGKPLNKQTLLETVWADSIVTEQVIFQSINEIRQLFPNLEAIKTIPKQGYVWLPDVVVKEDVKPKKIVVQKALFALCALVVVLALYLVFIAQQGDFNEVPLVQQNISGSIVVLPIQNQIEGNDHSWVRLGMMDQVIQRLPNSQYSVVLQTDYVLEVLKRASAPLNNLLPAHIQQIFKVSGAELIVSSKLIGAPHDYQLSYVFYYRDRLKKGVLFNKKIQSLVDEFSLLIAAKLGDEVLPLEVAYQADFNNELLNAAIEKHLEGNYQLATPMLESIVLNNPENLTAQRLLVTNLFRLKLLKQAAERIDIALPIAKKLKDQDEITRLLYSKALHHYVTYNDSKAADIAEQALVAAKENNDWLFMAHIKNVQANLAFNKSNYQLAEALFYEEKQHHQVLHCPAGEAQSWANLAWLAKQQNQPEKFTTAINQAINIAKTRDLSSQLSYFIKTREQGFSQ
ncbi:MAG: winged helix-turn-helix domain-containing protein [Colwellia sp.]|nr:winged helix-turn-helix domain-containing protein [Colwellia sp.]